MYWFDGDKETLYTRDQIVWELWFCDYEDFMDTFFTNEGISALTILMAARENTLSRIESDARDWYKCYLPTDKNLRDFFGVCYDPDLGDDEE